MKTGKLSSFDYYMNKLKVALQGGTRVNVYKKGKIVSSKVKRNKKRKFF